MFNTFMTWSVAFGFIRNGIMTFQPIKVHSLYERPEVYIEYAKWMALLILKKPMSPGESLLKELAYGKYHATDKHEQRLEYVIDDMHHPAIFVDRNKMVDNYYKTHLHDNGVFLSIALFNYDTVCFEYYRTNDSEIKNVLTDNLEYNTKESKYLSEVLNTPQYVSIPFSELENIKLNSEVIISCFQDL